MANTKNKNTIDELHEQADSLLQLPFGMELSRLSFDEQLVFIELYKRAGGGEAMRPKQTIDYDQLRSDLIELARDSIDLQH